jgi:hypothetical protein
MRKLRISTLPWQTRIKLAKKRKEKKEVRFINSPHHPGLLLEMRLVIINSVSNVIDDYV